MFIHQKYIIFDIVNYIYHHLNHKIALYKTKTVLYHALMVRNTLGMNEDCLPLFGVKNGVKIEE